MATVRFARHCFSTPGLPCPIRCRDPSLWAISTRMAVKIWWVTNPSAASISVLLGKGDGTFRAPLIFGAGVRPVSVAVGDFNSDHVQDLALTGSFVGTSVLLGNGNGTFGMPLIIGVVDGNGLIGKVIVTGDFNGDAIQDLAVTGSFVGTSVLLGNGNGTFQPTASFPTTSGSSMAIGDLNGDTRPDIAVVG
jgi:FG-GAP-like repeat